MAADPPKEPPKIPNAIGKSMTEVVDQDGDVLVQTGNRDILVSSKILGLASPVFSAMLNSVFKEGQVSRSSQHPLNLPLPDDDPDALAGLFRAWHFSAQRDQLFPSIDTQLEMAVLADKYDCAISIQITGKYWLLTARDEIHNAATLWKLATVAFLLNLADGFSNFTATLIKSLSAQDLKMLKLHETLPYTLRAALQQSRQSLVYALAEEVQDIFDDLLALNNTYGMDGKVCTRCHLPTAQNTHNTKCPLRTAKASHIAGDRYCNGKSRVYELLLVLKKAEVWPLTKSMEKSPSAMQQGFATVEQHLSHNCSGGKNCPLVLMARNLPSRASSVIAKYKGLDLQALKEESL